MPPRRPGRSGATPWARSTGAPTRRTCPPASPCPGRAAYAILGGGDHGSAYVERGEIYDLVRDARITGLRDRVGRPAQLLGRLCRQGPSAEGVRAGRGQLRRRLARQPGRDGVLRAPAGQGPSAAAALPRGPARRRQAGVDVQHAAEARRPLVPRVREDAGPRPGSRALQSDARAAPGVRRPGRSRLREGAAVRRRDAHRVRVHPAPDHAQRAPRRRSAPLSGRPHAPHSGSPESGPSCAATSSREIRACRSERGYSVAPRPGRSRSRRHARPPRRYRIPTTTAL